MSFSIGQPRRAKATLLAALQDGPGGKKRVNFEVTEEVHRKLKILATQQGMSVKDYLTSYIESQPDPL